MGMSGSSDETILVECSAGHLPSQKPRKTLSCCFSCSNSIAMGGLTNLLQLSDDWDLVFTEEINLEYPCDVCSCAFPVHLSPNMNLKKKKKSSSWIL